MFKIQEHEIKKIAILRALQLGDILCSIPAIRSLRKACPNAEILFLGMENSRGLIKRFSEYIDGFIAFPGYPGLPEQVFDQVRYNSFHKDISRRSFDLVLQMQGNGSIVNEMLNSFGARYIAGFCEKIQQQNDLFLRYPDHGHEITRHLELMAHLGIPCTGATLEFPLYEEDFDAYKNLRLPFAPHSYICIHPGSRGVWRQWPPYYFAQLGNYCTEIGYRTVLTGSAYELELVTEVASLMHVKPLIVAGKTSLGALALLLKNAFALIANCTGVSHLAAATATPSLIISMDGEPGRWAPLNNNLHQTIDWTRNHDYELAFETLKVLLNNR